MSRMTARSTATGRRRIDELTSEIKSIANSTFLELTRQSPQFGELNQTDNLSFFTSAFNTAPSGDSFNATNGENKQISISNSQTPRQFEFPNSQYSSVNKPVEQSVPLANLNSSPRNPIQQEIGRKTPTSKSMILQDNIAPNIPSTRSSFVGTRGLSDSLSKLHAKVDNIITRSPAQSKKLMTYQLSASKENVAPTPVFNSNSTNNQSFQADAQDYASVTRITPQKDNLKLNLKVNSLPPLPTNSHQEESVKKSGNQTLELNSQRSPMASLHANNIDQENYKSQKIPSTLGGHHNLYNSAVLSNSSPKKQPYDKAKLDRILQNINRRKDSQAFSSNLDNSSTSILNSKSTTDLGRPRLDFEARGKLL